MSMGGCENGLDVICIDNLVTGNIRNIEHIDLDNFTYLKHDVTKSIYFDNNIE
jgi:dTDP-glucose 4,6-dehydratase